MEGQAGPRTDPEIRESGGNYFLGGFGRKWPCPKASWAPYNPFPSHGSPSNPMGDHFLHKTIFFQAPCLVKKGPPASQGPNLGSGVPKIAPGVENTKVACRKTMQKTVVGTPNGAICCKLWPKTMSHWMWQNPKQMCLQTRQRLCLQTRHLLCHQTTSVVSSCQQTSPKTSPRRSPHRGGR